jgi:hypothetical protein
MGLVRTALIFGAGYVLGRPEGQAKVVELAQRPEVAQLRQQAVSTVSGGLRRGKKQVAEATGNVGDKVSEQGSAQTDGSGTTTGMGGWRGRRLPSFPRRGARHAAPAVSPTTPLSTATDTETSGGGTSTGPVSAGTVSAVTTPTGTTPEETTPSVTTPSATTPPGTASAEPEVPAVRRTPPLPPTGPRD